MSIVYLFAFSSLYVQIPGLYGNNGLMPARLVMEKEAKSWEELLREPSLLKLTPKLGLDTETGMDFLCLLGMLISLYCMISHRGRDFISFLLLWVLYLSLYQVGQTFLWFQWDILLLEAGFLCVIVAPFVVPFFPTRRAAPHDFLTIWLVRWLLFRLMFASGVVKLTSQCPTWWGLTALTVHFESQCIPTPLAWYWHHFPGWFLKLGVVGTYVIEIGVPFLFFVPNQAIRVFSFYTQILLQFLIIATGNYNFFNLLTMALCIPLLDDDIILGNPRQKKLSRPWLYLTTLASILIPGLVLGLGAYCTIQLFDLDVAPDYSIWSKIRFSESQFKNWLEQITPWTMRLGAASLGLEIVLAIGRSFAWYRGILQKNWALLRSLFFGVVAVCMFSVSLVDLSVVDRSAYSSLPQFLRDLRQKTDTFQLTNSYGLFRRMTGVGGRPEVIVEGSYEKSAGWKEYHFLYKPGNLSARPPFVAPHQPRLDWQMWFAALGNYQSNPWFVTLLYRLLTGQPEVLELMGENPFPDKPPNYVRATLYHYHYTDDKPSRPHFSNKDWWWRTQEAEYIPVMSKDLGSLKEFLQHYRILEKPPKTSAPTTLSRAVKWLRAQVGQPEGFTFVTSVFASGLFVWLVNRRLF